MHVGRACTVARAHTLFGMTRSRTWGAQTWKMRSRTLHPLGERRSVVPNAHRLFGSGRLVSLTPDATPGARFRLVCLEARSRLLASMVQRA